MNDDALRCSTTDRERTQSLLGDALSRGQLQLHEFDERVQHCIAATTRGDLVALVDDLVPDPRQALFCSSGRQAGHPSALRNWNPEGLLGNHHGFAEVAAAEAAGRAGWQVEKQDSSWQKLKRAVSAELSPERHAATRTDVFCSSTHRSNWTIGAKHTVELALGSATLDLRTARFSATNTSIRVAAMCGRVKIVVPQGIRIDCSDQNFLASLKQRVEPGAASPATLSPDAPLVSIRSESAFASVEVIIAAH